jgi:membrane protease YdiL (CAAX protease family)
MKSSIKKHTYIFIIAFLIFLNILLGLIMQIANIQLVQYKLYGDPTLYLFIKAMGRLLIIGCLCLPALKKLNLLKGCSLLSPGGIKKGIVQSWILVIPVGYFAFEALSAEEYNFAGWTALCMAILLVLSIGIMEELVYRGLILQLLVSKWKGQSVNRAIIISSMIFGAEHIVNISYNTPLMILVVSQRDIHLRLSQPDYTGMRGEIGGQSSNAVLLSMVKAPSQGENRLIQRLFSKELLESHISDSVPFHLILLLFSESLFTPGIAALGRCFKR